MSKLSDFTKDTLGAYLNVEVAGIDDLKEWLRDPELFQKFGHKFKEEFADIILHRRLTPDEFETITSDWYPTEQELYTYLKSVWAELFDGEPLPKG